MFVSYCYLLSFRKLTTPFTLKRLLISKEEKELVNSAGCYFNSKRVFTCYFVNKFLVIINGCVRSVVFC